MRLGSAGRVVQEGVRWRRANRGWLLCSPRARGARESAAGEGLDLRARVRRGVQGLDGRELGGGVVGHGAIHAARAAVKRLGKHLVPRVVRRLERLCGQRMEHMARVGGSRMRKIGIRARWVGVQARWVGVHVRGGGADMKRGRACMVL